MEHQLCPLCEHRHPLGAPHIWDDGPGKSVARTALKKPVVEKPVAQETKPVPEKVRAERVKEPALKVSTKKPFDRRAYQREYLKKYMRLKRASDKLKKKL